MPRPKASSMQAWTAVVAAGMISWSMACGAGASLRIIPHDSLTDSAELAGLVLRIGDREFSASELADHPEIRVPGAGSLAIDVELWQDGSVVAEGTVGWEMQEEYEWELFIFRKVEDPRTTECIGCGGSEGLEIAESAQTTAGEQLWCTWGGTRRGSDVVY